MIDLRQIQALIAVAEEGSVARAATRLGWSQPTVDYHLKNLDRLAGIPLTTRSSRGSQLTAPGHLMRERGEEILNLADRALTDVRDLAAVGRTKVRFGTFPTAAARLLPGIAALLSNRGIEIDTTLAEVPNLVEQVNRRELDAALLYRIPGFEVPFRADVRSLHVLTDPLLLALPTAHPLAAAESIDEADLPQLASERWVLGSTPGDAVDEIVREVVGAGRSLATAVRSDDYAVVLGLIAAGMGVALIPSLMRANPPEGVVLRPINSTRFTRELVLAAPAPKGADAPIMHLSEAVRRAIHDLD
ncbi:LysR family transcriptional regulator [Leucobacter sp. cx-328]|uniref:LysR family transcriptional regulator n=1 Tax=unclassified Leucobacter TaxID=2621730 RepID=UPI00165DC83E|nr:MULTISPECIES: LysR family transcriptional regulator [unclassified Leucobacter]MBC9943375.1 LysR family transcriptional regulator [Leucobacter sp. cx-328]